MHPSTDREVSAPPQNTRILLADDHELVRHGLRRMLEARSGWSVCGEASTGLEAIDLARSLKPDVVILDLRMPELNGLEAAREIAKLVPPPEILILTVDGSEQAIRDVLDA